MKSYFTSFRLTATLMALAIMLTAFSSAMAAPASKQQVDAKAIMALANEAYDSARYDEAMALYKQISDDAQA